jgi:thiosulfate reductase cytochrome b subunit
MRIHRLPVRLTHWINAAAMSVMISSGWRIYDASPLFPFVFPEWMTLGGWLGGALAWHFAAMWVLAANFTIYLAYGLVSGHLRRCMFPLRPRDILRDFIQAMRLRLMHKDGEYNSVQRLFYISAVALTAAAIGSGLGLWKPVQFAPLTALLGGYEAARRVHFLAMAGLVGFIVVHLALVAIVPRTLVSMLTGRVPLPGRNP